MAPPETAFDSHLWALLEEGGEQEPLLTRGEAQAAMLLLDRWARGDAEGHEPAFQLASALKRRLAEM